jgi:hypothetical protein
MLPAACYFSPAIAYFLLLQHPESWLALAGTVSLLGYFCGACGHFAPYLTTRYGGLRAFGSIFGVVEGTMALSAGVGPILAGIIFDRTGSYAGLLMGGIATATLAAITLAGLGPYPAARAAGDNPPGPLPASGLRESTI